MRHPLVWQKVEAGRRDAGAKYACLEPDTTFLKGGRAFAGLGAISFA